VKYRTSVFAMLMVLLLIGAGYAQQTPANSSPDIPQAVAAKAQPLKVIHREVPVYPPEAKSRRLMGTVVVEAVVDRQGNVVSAKMINGHKIFEDAALTAIKAWKFSPATLEGQPVEQKTRIQLNFLDTAPASSAAAK
jgi:periplasmic protein TonB